MCCLMALQAAAQVKISGKVIDEKEQPIDFATVRIEGTAVGTVTDTKGMYELTVPPADTIMVVFSCSILFFILIFSDIIFFPFFTR